MTVLVVVAVLLVLGGIVALGVFGARFFEAAVETARRNAAVTSGTGSPTRTQRYYQSQRLRDQMIDEWRLRWHAKLLAAGHGRHRRRSAYLALEILRLDAETIDVPHTEVYKTVREVVGELDHPHAELPLPDELVGAARRRIFPPAHPLHDRKGML